jgi:hypothetical protein
MISVLRRSYFVLQSVYLIPYSLRLSFVFLFNLLTASHSLYILLSTVVDGFDLFYLLIKLIYLNSHTSNFGVELIELLLLDSYEIPCFAMFQI